MRKLRKIEGNCEQYTEDLSTQKPDKSTYYVLALIVKIEFCSSKSITHIKMRAKFLEITK